MPVYNDLAIYSAGETASNVVFALLDCQRKKIDFADARSTLENGEVLLNQLLVETTHGPLINGVRFEQDENTLTVYANIYNDLKVLSNSKNTKMTTLLNEHKDLIKEALTSDSFVETHPANVEKLIDFFNDLSISFHKQDDQETEDFEISEL